MFLDSLRQIQRRRISNRTPEQEQGWRDEPGSPICLVDWNHQWRFRSVRRTI